jgi:hypothetical protein
MCQRIGQIVHLLECVTIARAADHVPSTNPIEVNVLPSSVALARALSI